MEQGRLGPARGRGRTERKRASKAQLRWRLHVLLAVADASVLLGAQLLAGALRFGRPFAGEAMQPCALLLSLYLAAAMLDDAYATPALLDPRESVRRSVRALGLAFGAAIFILFLLQASATVSRFTLLTEVGGAAVGLAGARWFLARNARAILGGDAYAVVVIRDGDVDAPLGECTVFTDAGGVDPTSQAPDTFHRLGRLAEGADRVIVACPPERRLIWAAALQGANVQAEVVAPELTALAPMGLARRDGVATLIVAREPLSLRDRVVKRAFDLTVAIIVALVFAPLLLAAVVAIRLTSPGPVLFRQQRLGRRNRPFTILKLRTMRVEATDDAGARSTCRRDDRVTRVGRLLRATSLDELPQLLNVLRGEMSIVGPRPHALGSRVGDRLFWELDHRYWDRHAVRPGMTGLAQIRGLRGATEAGEDLTRRLRADLEYRERWTIWRDIAILLRTGPALIGRNVY